MRTIFQRAARLPLIAAACIGLFSAIQCGGGNSTGPTPSTTSAPTVAVVSVTPSSSTAVAGSTLQATVALNGAAAAGATVTLTSSNTAVATVPSSVNIAAGAASASFTVTTVGAGQATITATFNGSAQATLTVSAAVPGITLLSLGLNAPTITGGQSVDGVVTLSGPAPSGGAVVTLQSSDTSVATVGASVTVPAGGTTATFTVTSRATGGAFQLVISGTYGGVTRSANLTVSGTPPPLALSSVAVNPSTIASGATAQGTVSLNQAAPAGGTTVALSASPSGVVTIPVSVTVNAGSSSASFSVAGVPTTTDKTATITASFNSVSQTAAVTVSGSGPVASFVVGGPSGTDTCKLGVGATTADCTFDGRGSTGAVAWDYTWVVGSQSRTGASGNGVLSPTFPSCGFFTTDYPSSSNPTSIQMEVRLRVRDSSGATSAEFVNRNVRIIPNHECGYGF
jgi:hypothetical protein